jgi:lipoyl(octanoyl) transferase
MVAKILPSRFTVSMQRIAFTPQHSYQQVLEWQENAVADVINGGAERTFMGEHAPMFTCGTSADAAELLNVGDIPVIATGRGGKTTYHGPGQLVVYPIINLAERGRDIRLYVHTLQQVIIETLADFNITAHTTDNVGVWVATPQGDQKIAAIGVKVRKWVAFHGFSLNIAPDLAVYQRIIPCGLKTAQTTSLAALGVPVSLSAVENAVFSHISAHFPPICAAPHKGIMVKKNNKP